MFFVKLAVVAAAAIFGFFAAVDAATDPKDVQALQVLYTSLNSPTHLIGWKSSGGDPCGESWKGIVCQGSSVVSVQIYGLGLNGTMGYLLHYLVSLKTLDLSNNNIHDTIPYQLPPNLASLNLAANNLIGILPYSISSLDSLNYLNISHNKLSQTIGHMFVNPSALATLDISFNNFTGDLPHSFTSLTNLSTLLAQYNQLTGSLDVLVGLHLTNLNVANNHFSGQIPQELNSVSSFIYEGNAFDGGPASPPPSTSPPRGIPHNGQAPRAGTSNSNGFTAGPIVALALGSLSATVFLLLVLFFNLKRRNEKEIANRPSGQRLTVSGDKVNMEMQGQRSKVISAVFDPVALPSESITVGRWQEKNEYLKRAKHQMISTSYTVAALQTASSSFSQENLVGESSLGRLYRAEFPNGKIMAIRKVDHPALKEEENFLESVSNMSRLRHPNIVALTGYCAEHEQRLLVHDYIGNGSLHDMLHSGNERSEALTWSARVRVALGTARALEYLHEVCLPHVVHRNIKSANILLDKELNPHLSDCGLAALAPKIDRQFSSNQMIGSFGYIAPEFASSGIYTVKSDVYSFGVVMLELLTGQEPLDSSRGRLEQSLVTWATPQLLDIDALDKIVDPALNGMYPAKSLSGFADVIALCVRLEPELRPLMSEVASAGSIDAKGNLREKTGVQQTLKFDMLL